MSNNLTSSDLEADLIPFFSKLRMTTLVKAVERLASFNYKALQNKISN